MVWGGVGGRVCLAGLSRRLEFWTGFLGWNEKT